MNAEILHLGLIDDDAIMLDSAALDLAALDHPDVDVGPLVDQLGQISERIAEAGMDAHDSAARVAVLAQVIGGEYGFTGDRTTYDDPANADMIRVLERRRGLPVSLAILYVAAARRLGWSAVALDTPGHVLVRVGADVEPVLIDPFSGGVEVGSDALAALLARILGPGTKPAAGHVAAMSNRSVLVRLLLNQAMRAEKAGQSARALTLFERMTVIAPGAGHAWWERARLELAAGRVAAARASLSAMLEMTRDPVRREQISDALAALAGSDR
ncbi:MAG TPA: transglutaminase-like domain-containing protein [Sphingomonas sp.]|jgi:regulator of sirC expression with transglutaminase-like and TPR domain|uniref:SirB1 family protein n=1 Tax=Sphingomonas sp. TaxID=28214 RepID=UPI002EDA8E2F